MPRDGSGNYSRVIPPGASGYQPSTPILSAQVNAEIADLGNEVTNSISKTGTTTPTANLPMGNFIHTGLGQASAAGQSLRYEALGKGADIAVTANGTVALPFEGSLFNLTAASAFNVTGFTGRHDGRPFCVRFNPDKLLKLVNSATFKLLGGTDRITKAGEIIHFAQESSGTIAEVGQQPVIDMTGYSGADIPLGIGQTAIYDISAVTSLLLRVATGNNQRYQLTFDSDYPASANLASEPSLQVNNANFGTNVVRSLRIDGVSGTNNLPAFTTNNQFRLTNNAAIARFDAVISTKTTSKTVFCEYLLEGATNMFSGTYRNDCTDVATAWTSLGTVLFIGTVTGRVTVKRLS